MQECVNATRMEARRDEQTRFFVLVISGKYARCSLPPAPQISYKSTAILHARVFIMSSSICVNMIFIVCNKVIIKAGRDGRKLRPFLWAAAGTTRREYADATCYGHNERFVKNYVSRPSIFLS